MSKIETQQRNKILILSYFYAPGFRGGGPIQSVSNIVRYLGEEYDYYVVTMDRDLGSSQPYEGIQVNKWQRQGNASVFYVRKSSLSWWTVARIVMTRDFDLIYFNSFFDPRFTTIPLLVLLFGKYLRGKRTPCLLAPRGQFSHGALALHPIRKKCFLKFARLLRLHANVTWHASSKHEETDILREIGKSVVKIGAPLGDCGRIFTASDLVSSETASNTQILSTIVREKHRGAVVVGFVSRISPMKNLEFALEILAGVRGNVQFNIYGPAEDGGYWKMCQKLIDGLPANITARWHGELPHAKVAGVLQSLHLLLLPTRGENFGHIISEALSNGCPVLISNLTPWRNLTAKGVGWDLPIDDARPFRNVIEKVLAMDNDDFQSLSRAALEYARSHLRASGALEQNQRMFNECLHPNNVAEEFTP